MKALLTSILVICFAIALQGKEHPETSMSFDEYCKFYNYPVEIHLIETEDSYVLQYFRIQKKNSSIQSGLQPVILQHGILDSSDTFIVNSDPEENAPAFYFANKGYDVWLANSRGNKYSLGHKNYNHSTDSDYWKFSFQEMAQFDLPAAFTYINKVTEFGKIHMIGHSEGTAIMWAALSEKNPIIKRFLGNFVAMGPVAFVKNIESSLIQIGGSTKVISLFNFLNIHSLLMPGWLSKEATPFVCSVASFICGDVLKIISDDDVSLDNIERMDVIMGHYPSGASTQDVLHWNQLLVSGEFKKFDHGTEALNMKYYGQPTPPVYDLSNVDIPVSLFIGLTDKLADKKDADHLIDELKGSPDVYYKYLPGGHGTFLWGKDMSFLKDVEARLSAITMKTSSKHLFRFFMGSNITLVLFAGKEFFYDLRKCLEIPIFEIFKDRVKDDSMYPALKRDDLILINKTFNYEQLEGKIVLLYNPFTSKKIVRRVLGVDRSWIQDKDSSYLIRVPGGNIWVENDNRTELDELTVEFAPNNSHKHQFSRSLIIGEAVFQIRPFSQFGAFNALSTFDPSKYDGKIYHSPFKK